MRRNRLFLAGFLALLASLQACNFPRPAPSPQNPATMTALAMTQGPGVPVTGGTGTPTQAILSPQTSVDCRTGPGAAYALVATLNPGAGFLVIGEYSAGSYWIIANPAGGSCWVAGRKVTVYGDTSRLPEYPAPSKPTAFPSSTAIPAATALPAPGALTGSRACGKGFNGKTPIWIEDVVLTWQPGSGQAGYRIYRGSQFIGSVPANVTTDTIQFTYPRSANAPSDTFGVEAFIGSATSVRATVNVPRCP